ncbi:MAG TPA: methyl-accepting chemotaxis protein, partial [Thermoguttaceae bacterium]|nr:methyl-accepting chemotaxis protein [Thermoguttaceae bacterium]
LKAVLTGNPAFDAVYTCWEPDAFDAKDAEHKDAEEGDPSGRFVAGWKRAKENQIVPAPRVDYADEDGQYLQVKKSPRESVFNPRIVNGYGRPTLVVSLVVPIMAQGTFCGVVGVDMRLGFLQEVADGVNLYDRSGKMTVISNDGTICAATGQPGVVGRNLMQLAAANKSSKQEILQWLALVWKGERRILLNDTELVACAPVPIGKSRTPWSVEVRAPRAMITKIADQQMKGANTAMWRMVGIGALCAAVALAYLWFAAGRLIHPILCCARSIVALSKQDFTQPCRVDSRDEIGRMAEAINQSIRATKKALDDTREAAHRETLAREERAEQQRKLAEVEEARRREEEESERRRRELESRRVEEEAARERQRGENDRRRAEEFRRKVDELLEVVKAAAGGDLTKRITTSGDESITELARGIGKMLEDLSSIIGQVTESADQFSEGSLIVAQGAQTLAQGAQTQSMNVDGIAAAIEELAHSIEAVKRSASDANQLAQQTNQLAERGDTAVSRSIEGMELIRTSSQQMSEIIQVISDIAGQTNLLALNAAIEAARAGAHGMGFAVVADEVRKLAERSDQAAKQIAVLIRESTKRVAEGTQLSDETGDALKAIIAGVEATAQKIEEIAEATIQQASNANEVARAVQEVAAITEQTTAGSQEIASSSQQLGAQANFLRDLVSHFRTDETGKKIAAETSRAGR